MVLSGLAGIMLLGGADQEVSKAEATGVLGRMVHDSSGQQVGRVVDVVVDPSGTARAIVVDTGGFMGLGARRVAVNWNLVHVPPPGSKDDGINIDLSDDQVKSAPEYTDRSKPAPIVGGSIEPSLKPADLAAKSSADAAAKPSGDTATKMSADPAAKPSADPAAKPSADPAAKPSADPAAKP